MLLVVTAAANDTNGRTCRVSVYSRFFYPSVGGVETTTHLLATALATFVKRVEVLTLTPLGGNAEPGAPYGVRRLRSSAALVAAVRQSDLVILKGGLSLPGAWAASLARKPLVIWHEMDGPLPSSLPPCKRLFYRLLGGPTIVRSAIHVGVTQACLASKSLPRGCQTAVIYNPVSPDLAKAASARARAPLAEEKSWDLLFVGRLVECKGIAVLAEALRQLDADGWSASVGIVGEGPLAALINGTLLQCRNIKATLTGALQHGALGEAYARSAILVCPSIWPEGMGLVPAEAMTFGVPVVASSHPAISEVVGDAGLFTAPGDVSGLAAAMRTLLRDHALRKTLASRALARAEMFSFSRFVSAVAQLVGEVCGRARRGQRPRPS